MANERSLRRYRSGYARLLRLYPKTFRDRFGAGMAQTFADLLRERAAAGKGTLDCVLWMYGETLAGIIKEKRTTMTRQNKNIVRIALVTGLLLLIPLTAMQFDSGVNWSPFDFLVAGALLFGAGLAFERISSRSRSVVYRAAVGLAVAAALLLTWINLAVGIIGSEDNPANLMYLFVPAVVLIGAIIVRFRPRGMTRAMLAAAALLVLIPVVALLSGRLRFGPAEAPPGAWGVLALNGFFAVLFVASALLFRRAGVKEKDHSAA
jgi:hypothetical protein